VVSNTSQVEAKQIELSGLAGVMISLVIRKKALDGVYIEFTRIMNERTDRWHESEKSCRNFRFLLKFPMFF